MQNLTQEIVENCDVILYSPYALSHTPIRQIHWQNEIIAGKSLQELSIIGTAFIQNQATLLYPEPHVWRGSPKIEPEKDSKRYYGTHFTNITSDGIAELDAATACYSITLHANGTANMYIGQMDWVDAILFPKPIAFDPNKRLIYLRSPTNKYVVNESYDKTGILEEIILHQSYILDTNPLTVKIIDQSTDLFKYFENLERVPKRIDIVNIGERNILTLAEAVIDIDKKIINHHQSNYLIPPEGIKNLDTYHISSENCAFQKINDEEYAFLRKASQKTYTLAYVDVNNLLTQYRCMIYRGESSWQSPEESFIPSQSKHF